VSGTENARARPDRDMTTGEAEAWQAGWAAARDRCVAVTSMVGPPLFSRRQRMSSEAAEAADSAVRRVIDAIRAMEPPKETQG
jgi:hypothetical protein